MAAPLDAIRQVPLFHELDEAEIEQVARLFKQRTFAAGETGRPRLGTVLVTPTRPAMMSVTSAGSAYKV